MHSGVGWVIRLYNVRVPVLGVRCTLSYGWTGAILTMKLPFHSAVKWLPLLKLCGDILNPLSLPT